MTIPPGQPPRPGTYPFGLSTAEEDRASRLHAESIVIDLLSQHAGGNIFAAYPPALQAAYQARMAEVGRGFLGIAESLYWPYEQSLSGASDLIRDWYRESGLTCGTYHIVLHDGHHPVGLRWNELTARYASLPWMRYVTTAAEIRAAKRDGVLACYANCQPTIPIPRDLTTIDTAYARGLRSLMLTYNRMDNVGAGCTERVDGGLSRYGLDVVKRCNQLGIIVDTSHCGPATTLDACRHSTRPVNANHTCARSVYPSARGKTDEALRAIADTGGVIGVVAVPFFLAPPPRGTMDDMLDHIDYIANLVGWQHVAIGTDWPMQAPDAVLRVTLQPEEADLGFRPEDNVDVTNRLIGFDDVRDFPNVTRGLVKRGYSDEAIKGILGENALRVFAEVCGG